MNKTTQMDKVEAISQAMQELEYEFWNAEGKRTKTECEQFTKQWQELQSRREKLLWAVVGK